MLQGVIKVFNLQTLNLPLKTVIKTKVLDNSEEDRLVGNQILPEE